MTKDEMKNRISMALKDPVLQQGFEIICKENAELKSDNDARKYAMAMSENVERQLRGQLTNAKGIIKKYYEYNPRCEYFYEDIDNEAEQFLKVSKEKRDVRKWNYPAKGEMPENCSCVLCFLKDGGCETAYYESGEFTFCAPAYHAQDVTAWQELPEEPEHD